MTPDSAPLRHILVIAIGPVQPFIAAARRTRDLWFGSALLSRLAAAAARSVADHGVAPASANLIFPADAGVASGAADLTAGISNKIVSVVTGIDPALLMDAVKDKLFAELDAVGTETLDAIGRDGRGVAAGRFRSQLHQLLECFGAWARWEGSEDLQYRETYLQANEMLDARKRLRDFSANACADRGLALSSLDAAGETVILPDRNGRWLRAAFGIDSTEELDAIGLVKRVLGRQQHFPAVTRIALAPWISSWPCDVREKLDKELKSLEEFRLASRNRCTAPDPSAIFPWDGELLLAARRREQQRRFADHAQALGFDEHGSKRLQSALDGLDTCITTHRDLLGMPGDDALYVAMLIADGDHMGPLLSDEGQSLPGHRAVSRALAAFAGHAREVVFAAGGACIYAGGDDVLALCPVAGAVDCARALSEGFRTTVKEAVPDGEPSLSVGVAIAHVLTPFATLRRLAERANRLAKDGPDGKGLRNAVALIVQPRNGAAIGVCGRWNEPPAGLPIAAGFDRRLQRWADMFADGELAGSAPYDLSTLTKAVPEQALIGEALRLIGRRLDSVHSAAVLAHVRQRLTGSHDVGANAARLADEWYVARWLAAHPQPPSSPDPSAQGTAPSNPALAIEETA